MHTPHESPTKRPTKSLWSGARWRLLRHERVRQKIWRRYEHKALSWLQFRPQPLLWWVGGVMLVSLLLASFSPPWGDIQPPTGQVAHPLSLPAQPQRLSQPVVRSRQVLIGTGERTNALLERLGIPKNLHSFLEGYRGQAEGRTFLGINAYLRDTRTITARFNEEGQLDSLDVSINRKELARLILHRSAMNTEPQVELQWWERAQTWAERFGGGVINQSLFATFDKANIPDSVVLQVADVLGTDIDFSKELRRGDDIRVFYRQLMIGGELKPETQLMAVHLINRGKRYQAYRFNGLTREDWPQHIAESRYRVPTATANHTSKKTVVKGRDESTEDLVRPRLAALSKEFFDDKGQSVIRGFLRNPLEFSRVSSQFSMARFHPVLHRMRAHTGVDFAASIGTPVRAVGDGVVSFAGPRGDYGNLVIIEHANQVETRYAHLNTIAVGIRQGVSVFQTQTIGTVGKTGLASGPHLHFEFRIAGRPHDPLTVAIPSGAPISSAQMAAFNAIREQQEFRLALAKTYPQMPDN